jgi:hypothetical protein
MAIVESFTQTRTNTSTPFWHESSDQIKSTLSQFNANTATVTSVATDSDDKLTSTIVRTFADATSFVDWHNAYLSMVLDGGQYDIDHGMKSEYSFTGDIGTLTVVDTYSFAEGTKINDIPVSNLIEELISWYQTVPTPTVVVTPTSVTSTTVYKDAAHFTESSVSGFSLLNDKTLPLINHSDIVTHTHTITAS